METFPLTLLKTFPFNTCSSLTKRYKLKTSKRVVDLAKPLHEDEAASYRFDSCLRRDGNPKTMKFSFGVQTMFTIVSKHYKFATNSF